MQPLKTDIIVFSHWYAPFIGGAEISLQEVIARIPEYNFHVVTALHDRRLPRIVTRENVTIHRVGFGSRWDRLLYPATAFHCASRLAWNGKVGLVWASMANEGGRAATLFKLRNPKVKYLLSLQEGETRLRLFARNLMTFPFYPVIYRKADAIHVVSNWLAARAELFNPSANIEIIPNGVDVQMFVQPVQAASRAILRNQHGFAEDDIILISVSRLVPKNGLRTLVLAMKKLPEEFKLLLVGSGPGGSSLQRLVSSEGLNGRVSFHGAAPRDRVILLLQMSDCFVRPSLAEGLGNAFLEAMAAGIPIVGTRVGGVRDFLIDGVTGKACRADAADSVASAVIEIFANKDLRLKIVKGAYETVSAHFALDTTVRATASLIQKLLKDVPPCAPS